MAMHNRVEYMHLGSNIAYTLDNNTQLLQTEYKVLKSQSRFVKCMKMLFNGKMQIFYYISHFQSLAELLPQLNSMQFEKIITELISIVAGVQNNGFLYCESVDIDFDRIYIDTATHQVNLLYIPVKPRIFESYHQFENEFRDSIAKTIAETPYLSKTPNIASLLSNLSNGALSLEHLGRKRITDVQNICNSGKIETLYLISMNMPKRIEIIMSEDKQVIGRNDIYSDDIEIMNKGISRKHCLLSRNGHCFSITDLDSTNGTFVNGIRLKPQIQYEICYGDHIRIASEEFRVEIR